MMRSKNGWKIGDGRGGERACVEAESDKMREVEDGAQVSGRVRLGKSRSREGYAGRAASRAGLCSDGGGHRPPPSVLEDCKCASHDQSSLSASSMLTWDDSLAVGYMIWIVSLGVKLVPPTTTLYSALVYPNYSNKWKKKNDSQPIWLPVLCDELEVS